MTILSRTMRTLPSMLMLVICSPSWAKNITDSCDNAAYDQCGGDGFDGEQCCPSDCVCDGDEWFQQCIPDSDPRCTTDADCSGNSTCVILPDGSFAQCVNCTGFEDTCNSLAPDLLVATEAACGVATCPGRCPNHTDAECSTSQKCAFSSDGTQDKCTLETRNLNKTILIHESHVKHQHLKLKNRPRLR